jgi:hypothetical protein
VLDLEWEDLADEWGEGGGRGRCTDAKEEGVLDAAPKGG